MPYDNFTRKKGGKTFYCMKNKNTGKTYCYKSKSDRERGVRVHEMFKHMPKSKIKIAKK